MAKSSLIVLDTHAWVWWHSRPDRIGKKAARAIARAPRIGIAAISIWEIAMKVTAGNLRFDRPCGAWIDESLACDPRVEVLHLLPRISGMAAELAWNHADPADRMIVATAQAHDAPLATADERILDSGLVRCVWD
jgi:PIN domain nuclease of toxin-antitoxin system